MSITEIIDSVQVLIDRRGDKKAVQLDWAAWEEILTLLEDLEDAEEIEQIRHEEDELIPWEQGQGLSKREVSGALQDLGPLIESGE